MVSSDLKLPTPVLILEDEPLIQGRLTSILYELGYFPEQIILANSLGSAKTLLTQHIPCFALIDLGLPDGNGIELIEQLKQLDANMTILVISAWSTQDAILDALRAGASGYVLKERDDIEVLLAIRSVLRGGAPIDPFIASQILSKLKVEQYLQTQEPADKTNTHLISIREHEILELVATGMTNREIAEFLNLSRYTIECHIRNIYRKLSVSTRTKAINTARSLGLLP